LLKRKKFLYAHWRETKLVTDSKQLVEYIVSEQDEILVILLARVSGRRELTKD